MFVVDFLIPQLNMHSDSSETDSWVVLTAEHARVDGLGQLLKYQGSDGVIIGESTSTDTPNRKQSITEYNPLSPNTPDRNKLTVSSTVTALPTSPLTPTHHRTLTNHRRSHSSNNYNPSPSRGEGTPYRGRGYTRSYTRDSTGSASWDNVNNLPEMYFQKEICATLIGAQVFLINQSFSPFS